MKVKSAEITDFMEFHRNGLISQKTANITESVTAVKLWIRLVPSNCAVEDAKFTCNASSSFGISPRNFLKL